MTIQYISQFYHTLFISTMQHYHVQEGN